MSEYNTKNYTKQGGDVTVIGGTLEFGPDAKVTGLPAATKTETGGMKHPSCVLCNAA